MKGREERDGEILYEGDPPFKFNLEKSTVLWQKTV